MADEEVIPRLNIHYDTATKETVSSLLQSWGLSELKSKFKSHQVETRALFCLTEKDICELIPKIGRRAIFRSSLMEWRRKSKKRTGPRQLRHLVRAESKSDEVPNIPIPDPVIKDENMNSDSESNGNSEHIPNNDAPSVDEIVSEEEAHEGSQSEPLEEQRFGVIIPKHRIASSCHVDVSEILANSYEGQQIITYYEVNGSFDYSQRRRLVTLIINEVIRKNRWLVQDDFAKISQDIVQLFPREDEATYYTARNGLKNPKGCLYNKFLNLTRKLRQEGILQYRNNVQLIPERTSARHSGEIKCYRENY